MVGTVEVVSELIVSVEAFNVIKQVLMPFRAVDDDYYALACDVSLVFVLIFTMFLKIIALTESEVGSTNLISVLTEEMRDQFYISGFWLTVGLFIGVISILTFLSIVAVRQVASAARGTRGNSKRHTTRGRRNRRCASRLQRRR